MPHPLLSARLQSFLVLLGIHFYFCDPLDVTTFFNATKACRNWVMFSHNPQNKNGDYSTPNLDYPKLVKVGSLIPEGQDTAVNLCSFKHCSMGSQLCKSSLEPANIFFTTNTAIRA